MSSIGPLPCGVLSWSVSFFFPFLFFVSSSLPGLAALSLSRLVTCLRATHCLSHHNMLSFFPCSPPFPVPLPSHLCFCLSVFDFLTEPTQTPSFSRARAISHVSSYQPTGAAETIKRRETEPHPRTQYPKKKDGRIGSAFVFIFVRACFVYARLRLGLTSYTAQRRLCSSPVLFFFGGVVWGWGENMVAVDLHDRPIHVC